VRFLLNPRTKHTVQYKQILKAQYYSSYRIRRRQASLLNDAIPSRPVCPTPSTSVYWSAVGQTADRESVCDLDRNEVLRTILRIVPEMFRDSMALSWSLLCLPP
jgi:hypothetical protein